MTSSTNQLRSTPNGHGEGPSYPDRTEKLDINGEVTQLTGKEKFCCQATKNQHPFVPPSDGTTVNTLPNELLSYIFTLGSEAEKSDSDAGEQRPHLSFQVLVSHVCRQWRAVAIETPTLWTCLNFEEGLPFDKSRAWLERSKGCPLDIVLDCTVKSDPPGRIPISPADLPVVRDLILPHYARWRVFDFMVDDFQLMYDMLSTLASIPEAPKLRELSLSYDGDYASHPHFIPVYLKEPFFAPFCGRTPELREVYLWGVHIDWETCVSLQCLEDLELCHHAKDVRPPYEVFTRILQGSPNLHTLSLFESGPAGHPEEDWPADVIELPSVRQLDLEFVEPSYASALLKRLVFLNVSVLSLDCTRDFDSEEYTAFIEQLASPPPNPRHWVCQNLVELKLSGMECSNTAPRKLYAALPNLISLTLDCYRLQPHFLTDLFTMVIGHPDGFFLPKLTTLTTSGISVLFMCHVVSFRRRLGGKIKHVRMDSKADVDKKSEAWLRKRIESFEFFDGEDEGTSVETTADLSAENNAEDGGVRWEWPPEWVDVTKDVTIFPKIFPVTIVPVPDHISDLVNTLYLQN